MWKLITEVDLPTGVSHRGFRYQEVTPDGKIVREFTLPEGVALELMKDLIVSFPQVVEGLIQEANAEHVAPQPEPQVPPPMQQRQPLPPPQQAPPPAPQEDVHTPLNLSPPAQAPRQGAFSLSDLAPVMEKDAPQG